VKKQQLILTGAGILLMASLVIFGSNVTKKEDPVTQGVSNAPSPQFNFTTYLQSVKQKLPINQQNYLDNLENSVKRGDVKEQQIKTYNQLGTFWKDSAHEHDLYNYYIAKPRS